MSESAGHFPVFARHEKGRFRGLFPLTPTPLPHAEEGLGDYFSFASARSASARSVFSHEKAVAVCFLPAPST